MAEWIALDQMVVVPQPGRIVGIDADGRRVGHAEFRTRVLGWQQAFAAAPGRDWALYFDDTLAFAAALLGAWHAGKRVFLGGDNLPATLDGLVPRVDGFAGDVPDRHAPLQSLADVDPDSPLDALDEDTLELVVFTSGSTGAPSAIGKRLRQLTREVDALQAAFGDQLDGAQVYGTVSHQHIYGLLFRVLWPLAAGRPIQPRRFFHEDLVSALAEQPSVLVATPAHLKRLPEQLDWSALNGRLRAVFSSGGPLPVEAALQARALLGVAPTEVFGSSETGGIAWRRWSADAPQWHPLPGVAWRIEDGCLSVSSPHLADSAWWQTQDRVEADAGQSFRLLGRVDRIVKIEERRVSLDALEQQLRAHPQVQDVRVLVLPGAREQLAAVVVPRAAHPAQWDDAARRQFARQLGEHLAQSHDAVTRPRRWRFVDELPYNAQGKTTAVALAALFRPLLPSAQWQQRDADAALLVLPLEPDLVAFDGHFPQAKILPGVVQLDWAIHYAREVFAMPPRFERMDALKFQHVARPGDRLQLTLGWDAVKSVLSFRYVSDHGVHASGRVVFGDA
ncbi:AMP-binding protein [Stenotrophomonas aracearum]|jgi:acyl-CoA synthetase (AMP-forming)/AMP-acid ligase II|uniref:Long-chain-fatty-acid--CoA ligase n=1 Tax=Stenotrophomonas aracearum TaxID=3003272 RepID=A0ABY9YCQ8_9GAMM|nr:AMP-binding protein [Stenotrophomonas sp. A5588]WNH48647.1 AMP-binding protein [Stenotrophomonas sp. A5588]